MNLVAGEVMSFPLEMGSFDFISVVATLHHLPLEPALRRFRELLAPGGVLAVIGLYRAASLADHSMAAVALPVSWMLRSVRGYWDMQARLHPPEATFDEIDLAAKAVLPGAELRRRLLFRYTLVWRKPTAQE